MTNSVCFNECILTKVCKCEPIKQETSAADPLIDKLDSFKHFLPNVASLLQCSIKLCL